MKNFDRLAYRRQIVRNCCPYTRRDAPTWWLSHLAADGPSRCIPAEEQTRRPSLDCRKEPIYTDLWQVEGHGEEWP